MAAASSSAKPLDASQADNWCKTQFKCVKFNYVWVIENFSLCTLGVGDVLRSSLFSADPNGEEQPKWCLQLYPNGKDSDSSENLALFVHLVSHNGATEVSANCKLGILNVKREQSNVRELSHKFKQNEGRGYEKFIRRTYLCERQNGLMSDDRLSIFCEISMPVGATNLTGHKVPPTNCSVPQNRMAEDFGALLEKELFADFVLCSDGKEFKVHKAVLACRSPVFAAMFEHAMEESRTNRVNIEDISAPVLGQLLHFIYTGCEPELLAEQDMAGELLAAADKYQLDRLKAMCEQQLSKGLNTENVCALLAQADRHSAEQLKAHAIDYINVHTDEVMEDGGWRNLSQPELLKQLFKIQKDRSHPAIIVSRPTAKWTWCSIL